jgi:hypothetical protein
MTNTRRTLTNFIKNHCDYISTTDLNAPSSSNTPSFQDEKCPICLNLLTEATSRIVQINLETCHHSIDDECFSRYLLAGFHICPFCRVEWFDLPDSASTTSPASVGHVELDERAVAPLPTLQHRPTDNESEMTRLRSLMRTQDANMESSGPVGSGPLFQEWPDWHEQEVDDIVVDTPQGPLPLRPHRRNAVVGGAHEYRRRPSGFAEEIQEELAEAELAAEFELAREDAEAIDILGGPASEPTEESEVRPDRRVWDHYWRGWVNEEGDIDGV